MNTVAVERLFEKAERMACAAGMSLARLVALGEQGATVPGPRPQMMMAREASSDRMAPPIEAGRQEVSATVEGAWALTEDESGLCRSPLAD